jgi:hypothetical protein
MGGDSNEEENRAQCDAWHSSGLAKLDAIMEVARLQDEVERLTARDEDLQGDLEVLRGALGAIAKVFPVFEGVAFKHTLERLVEMVQWTEAERESARRIADFRQKILTMTQEDMAILRKKFEELETEFGLVRDMDESGKLLASYRVGFRRGYEHGLRHGSMKLEGK